ncbi:MAG: DUF2070 family protein [Conexivisphaerales archaeon]
MAKFFEIKTESPNSELIKNYKYLVTFPKSNTLFILTSIISYLILSVSYMLKINLPWIQITEYAVLIFSTGALILYSVYYILSKESTIVSIRRLSISSTFSNIICALLFNLVSLFLPNNKSVIMYILILFLNLSINSLFITSLFSNDYGRSFITSVLLTTPASLILISSINTMTNIIGIMLSTLSGFLMVFTIYMALYKINMASVKKLNTSTLKIFKFFLNAWINAKGTDLENFLIHNSEEKETITWLIHIETESGRKLVIVVPYVHPGPFYPIGSYNLTELLCDSLTPNYNYCFVLHGPVDHTFNLCSKEAVKDYLEQLKKGFKEFVIEEPNVGIPQSRIINKIKIVSQQINGKYIVFLSSSEGGLEDYPPDLLYELKLHGNINEFIVVDSHNSLGPTPDKHMINELIHELSNIRRIDKTTNKVRIAFTKIAKEELGNEDDLGVNGVNILLLEIDGSLHALVNVDSNNSARSVREILYKTLQKYNITLIDLTTSDTHFNATRIRNSRGYFLFGERTSQERFVNVVTQACINLITSLEPFKIAIKSQNNKIKVIRHTIYSDFKEIIKTSIKTLMNSILILSVIFIIALLVTWVL